MRFINFEGSNRSLGAPKEWDPQVHGECGSLPCRVDLVANTPYFMSAWKPSAEELEALNRGESVILNCIGIQPAVSLSVMDVKEVE